MTRPDLPREARPTAPTHGEFSPSVESAAPGDESRGDVPSCGLSPDTVRRAEGSRLGVCCSARREFGEWSGVEPFVKLGMVGVGVEVRGFESLKLLLIVKGERSRIANLGGSEKAAMW